ncbi:MAG: 2-amino-4-hydroxy-6-hydroxymethyldihydropteridine diphosphokinase [Bacteroidia bacterium]
MEEAILLLGGNLGNRELALAQAMEKIEAQVGEITAHSLIYESEPWGFEDKNQFLNQAIKVNTQLKPQQLLDKLLEIEQSLGRVRTGKLSARVIDLDILFYGNEKIDSETLTIPHPRISERLFTLLPLAEVTDNKPLPLLNTTAQELIKHCPDKSKICIWNFKNNSQKQL